MKILYVFRHAKSSWVEAGQSDFDRPLAPRGQRAAATMGRYLRRAKIVPAIVFCSPAVRTRETLARIQRIWLGDVPVNFSRRLYLADPATLFATVRAIKDEHESAMLIGHEPGLSRFILSAARTDDSGDARTRIAAKFPTGALACLSFKIDSWKEVAPNSGQIEAFVRPRDLDD